MVKIPAVVTIFFSFLLYCDVPKSLAEFNRQKREVNWLTNEELARSAANEIFEYSFSPDPNIDIWGLMELKLYIPSSVKRVRGIYCYVPGWQGNSMVMMSNKSLRAYVENRGFALMTFIMEGEYTSKEEGISKWSGMAFLNGLMELAIKSGHPEIENAPLLFNGHSAGGQFGYHFTLLKPEQVIAFVTIKGGLHALRPAGAAIHVPAFMVIGEHDERHRKTNLTGIFNTHRPQRALWSLAMDPDSRHDPVNDSIKHAFFDAVIALRLPEMDSPNGPTKLKKVDEAAGWLGNSDTFSISSYEAYIGDSLKASWLPDKDFAKVWLKFISN